MEVTKEKLIALIKAVSTDPNVEKCYYNSEHDYYGRNFKHGINFYEKYADKEIVAYYHEEKKIYNEINFKKIYFDNPTVKLKNIVIYFEKEPPIHVRTISDYKPGKELKIEGTRWFFKKEVKAVISELTPEYKLSCGDYRFDLTKEEVEEMYQLILDEEKKHKKEAEDDEINSRFKKYGI